MMDKNIGQPGEDAAWISVDLPLPAGEVFAFTSQLERLFRLNPYLEIKSWQEDTPGKIYNGKQIHLDTLNEMNGMQQKQTLGVSDVQQGVSFCINYDSGLKQSSIFSVQALGAGSSRLAVKELYPAGMSAAVREQRLNEVDRSLLPWGAAVHSYFVRRARWGWLPLFSWWQSTFWLGMTPRHRRVTRMIIWTTVLEFVVFLFVFVIYWLEQGRALL